MEKSRGDGKEGWREGRRERRQKRYQRRKDEEGEEVEKDDDEEKKANTRNKIATVKSRFVYDDSGCLAIFCYLCLIDFRYCVMVEM